MLDYYVVVELEADVCSVDEFQIAALDCHFRMYHRIHDTTGAYL